MTTVSIIGGSGYGGGELIRLLLGHPNVEIKQVTSRSRVGEYVYQTHPNLRKRTQLKFTDPSQLESVDILFLAQPHGQAQKNIEEYAKLGTKIIDLAADFRLPVGVPDDAYSYGMKSLMQIGFLGAVGSPRRGQAAAGVGGFWGGGTAKIRGFLRR